MLKLFGKEEQAPSGKGIVPVDRVKELSSKGFSEPEIIDVLRKEGYSPEEIDKALTQALKGSLAETEKPKLPTLEELQTEQSQPTQSFQPQQVVQEPVVQEPVQTYPSVQEYPTEEIVESVVKEKMSQIDEKLSQFKMQYSELERKIKDIHNRLEMLALSRGREQQDILARLDALKDSMDELVGKISSLEKAFKEALPALIESVRALSDLVQRIKTS